MTEYRFKWITAEGELCYSAPLQAAEVTADGIPEWGIPADPLQVPGILAFWDPEAGVVQSMTQAMFATSYEPDPRVEFAHLLPEE